MRRQLATLCVFSQKQYHVSWQLGWTAAGILIGAVLSQLLPYQLFIGLNWLVLCIFLLTAAYVKRSLLALIMSLLAGIAIGLYVGAHAQTDSLHYSAYYGQEVHLSGQVADDTTRSQSGDQRVKLKQVEINDTGLRGNVWVSAENAQEIQRGDMVSFRGTLNEGFGTMHAAMFRAQLLELTRPKPGDVTRIARDNFSGKVTQHIEEPEASLGVSFLVGQRSALPEETQEKFRDLGLIHLVVASGFHLTIVVRFSKKLFVKRSKYVATAGSFFLIWSFLQLTGFSTSMVRAAIVSGLSLLAWYFGRNVHPMLLLLLVAATTVLINPAYIWSDMAWHLSFAAFAGVIILAPLLHAFFWSADKKPGFFRHLLVATTAAQITTFPIIALTFEQYSSLALLANLFVLPLVPLVMLGTFVTGMIGFMLPWLAMLAGIPTRLGLRYITSVAEYLAALPWAVSPISISVQVLYLYYVLLIGIMVYLQRTTNHSLRLENAID